LFHDKGDLATEYLAHSGKDGQTGQSYREHVENVRERSMRYAKEACYYLSDSKSAEAFQEVIEAAATWHDLGKLHPDNQAVLHKESKERHLPINHVDAGVATLLRAEKIVAALLVYSHHRGLPDVEGAESCGFRDEHPDMRRMVDTLLDNFMKIHQQVCQDNNDYGEKIYECDQGVGFRMMLSCLADADHTDTAAAYGQVPKHEEAVALQAEKRLVLLDEYVSNLRGNDERSLLRQKMYTACRDSIQTGGFAVCDSPVGSGKTTAVMAHLLKQAIQRKSRRIFVILPYTSIITQSVEVYRKALVLPGENEEEVVAELHCRADFQDYDIRYLSSLWRAPIVVTTAVAFFETLSSNCPSELRKLHELPGSVIFVDEFHGALPLKLLPVAWHWMNVLADEWGCYWALASGSLVRYWELERLKELRMETPQISNLVSESLRSQLMKYEYNRICFQYKERPLGRQELIQWVDSMPGPRLLILNTVRSAAVIANELKKLYGKQRVEHLSTALKASDRAEIIKTVRNRLKDELDHNWTLVATSCVEAGVDFSFRTGFREVSSLLSLLQAAGRVNRNGQEDNAEMWSFTLQEDSMLGEAPNSIKESAEVLTDYFSKHISITPELSTKSMNDEVCRNDICILKMKELIAQEEEMDFKSLNDNFTVIDADTVTTIVDESLANQICYGHIDWRVIQQESVSVYRNKCQKWHMKEIAKNLYQWTLSYDSFLGYMAGVIDLERLEKDTLMV
jgi:CRISPR-associated endonuclease Cas3-HD